MTSRSWALRHTRTSVSAARAGSKDAGALMTRISRWSLRFSLSKTVGTLGRGPVFIRPQHQAKVARRLPRTGRQAAYRSVGRGIATMSGSNVTFRRGPNPCRSRSCDFPRRHGQYRAGFHLTETVVQVGPRARAELAGFPVPKLSRVIHGRADALKVPATRCWPQQQQIAARSIGPPYMHLSILAHRRLLLTTCGSLLALVAGCVRPSSLAPATPAALGQDDVRWLQRAAFGLDSATLESYRTLGRQRWLDRQLADRDDTLPPAISA